MMTVRFAPTTLLAPSRLDSRTPVGLFRTTRESSAAKHLLIIDMDGRRAGIVLDSTDDRFNFVIWEFEEEDPGNWEGLSLGPVEVLVDTSSVKFSHSLRTVRGEISMTDGKAYIGAKFDREHTSSLVEVGACASGGTGCASFSRWQLVQRDYLGAPIVLFEQGGKTAA